MKVDSVKNQNFVDGFASKNLCEEGFAGTRYLSDNVNSHQTMQTVSFKAGNGFSKNSWRVFKNLSDYMKEPSEMVSAIIQAIGTSIVAPIAILGSPSRKAHTEEEKKEAKEKKVFQAFRQPFSALIALFFQIPATLGIAKIFDYFAYKKPLDVFKDKKLGALIPDKKYLEKQAKKALKDNADSALLEEWKNELESVKDKEKIKEAFRKSKEDEALVEGTEISSEQMEKMLNNEKKLKKFTAKQMASAKRESLIQLKIQELKDKDFKIKDIDLVTKDYEERAKETFKKEFEELKNKSLTGFDKFIKLMGLSNKNISKFDKAEKELAKQRGLDILKKDHPGILEDAAKKFEQYIRQVDEKSIKVYNNKKFWIQLLTNLAMVAISCTVLNWMHPKFMEFFEGMKQAKREQENRIAKFASARNSSESDGSNDSKKVEVRA